MPKRIPEPLRRTKHTIFEKELPVDDLVKLVKKLGIYLSPDDMVPHEGDRYVNVLTADIPKLIRDFMQGIRFGEIGAAYKTYFGTEQKIDSETNTISIEITNKRHNGYIRISCEREPEAVKKDLEL